MHRIVLLSCTVLLLTAGQLAAGAGTGTIIVLNKSDATASLIDRKSGRELTRVPTGIGPHEVAVSPDGKTAVVADYGQRQPGSTLTVIDLPKKAVTRTIDLGQYQRPHGIVYLPDGRHVVVTAEQQKAMLVVDVTEGKVVRAADTDQDISHMVAVSPDSKRAYVSNIRSGSVSVIDVDTGERVKIIETGPGAEGIDISPDGRFVWVGNRSGNTVAVIDTASLEIVEQVDSPAFPIRVKFTPDGRHVLVSNARSGDVAVFDAETRKLVKRIAMEEEATDDGDARVFGGQFGKSPVPIGILVTPDGREAYIANTNADVVTVLDLEKGKIARRITAGRQPDGLGYSALILE